MQDKKKKKVEKYMFVLWTIFGGFIYLLDALTVIC